MTKIFLVRHGITMANKENRFAGRTDEELHADGIEQICHVGERLREKNIAGVCCGPSHRTLQSAEILGSILKAPVSSYAGFDEINIPHWDGLTKDAIRQKYGNEYPTWLESPEAFQLPGCEKLEQVQERAVGAVDQMMAQHQSESLVLVSHLIVLRCLALYYQGLEIKDFRSIKIDNGSIIKLSELENGKVSVNYPV
ncbi:histidine phosphatase family protein [Thermodesulfobacteriota bacterium]